MVSAFPGQTARADGMQADEDGAVMDVETLCGSDEKAGQLQVRFNIFL